MAYNEKKYGRALLKIGCLTEKEFADSVEAVEWHKRMTTGWRRHLVDAAMIYNDKGCTDKMLRDFDMVAFLLDTRKHGLHRAYAWANEGKYGYEGMPEMLKRPKVQDGEGSI